MAWHGVPRKESEGLPYLHKEAKQLSSQAQGRERSSRKGLHGLAA